MKHWILITFALLANACIIEEVKENRPAPSCQRVHTCCEESIRAHCQRIRSCCNMQAPDRCEPWAYDIEACYKKNIGLCQAPPDGCCTDQLNFCVLDALAYGCALVMGGHQPISCRF